MNLAHTYEFDFLNGFTTILRQMLAALHSKEPAKMELIRTDSAQVKVADGVWLDVMLALEVSWGDSGSVAYRAATVEVTDTGPDSSYRNYGVRLMLYKGVGALEDPLLGEEKAFEGEFICLSRAAPKDPDWNPETGPYSAGQVIATAVYEFIRSGQPPESHEFLQTVLTNCEKE